MVNHSEKKLRQSAFQSTPNLEQYAYKIVEEQVQKVIKQEKKVLKDENPEPLHQMRVGTRRLRTALQVFEQVIVLPKGVSGKQLRDVARILGAVRDFDVQMATLKDEYQPNVSKREQKCIYQVVCSLQKQRKKAFAQIEKTFRNSFYQELKFAFSNWLEHPQYTAIAQLPLTALLPDLLSPLLSHLLLHPGWLVSTDAAFDQNAVTLHELRKALKHARYQTEFFTPYYGKDFQQWVKEVKELQEYLGQFQDAQVLQTLLADEVEDSKHLPDVQQILETKRAEALTTWEETRQKYLQDDYRYQLHQMLLQPIDRSAQVEPEFIKN
ncbi:MAG TPA: CHAD domain-containing protein [Leptolyngbyaceae cyanobacterium M33_DOE_097]|uniref:CHAD domain-containing protein n=1 Tax=Oscillatoriales cyanobacterium SpSt-418 TaxID=2282169 RepID=A0A7C3KH05_9CYAN|nr:CHAD domain-containing protein [Leptolyngbyaceae cyanobacterium M33_DOE_097]